MADARLPADATFIPPPDAGCPEPQPGLLTKNRNRLIKNLAARSGQTACELWAGFSDTQRGVFLTITDLLGKRSLLVNDYWAYYKSSDDGCDPAGTDCTGSCQVMHPEYFSCTSMGGYECQMLGLCWSELAERTNFETALDHVDELYGITDKGCGWGYCGYTCNGGSENNRFWFSADETLIGVIRNFAFGLPAWDDSSDLAGAHEPFNNSSETLHGRPRGQLQFWRWDSDAVTMERPGVEGVLDPWLVEIDIDYNGCHDSNPEGTYSGEYGRTRYEDKWYGQGFGGDAEFGWAPDCSAPAHCE